jgi:hypothetical protein
MHEYIELKLYVGPVRGGLDVGLGLGREAVEDERAMHVDLDLAEVEGAEAQRDGHADEDVDGDVAGLLALLERLLQAGSEAVAALHGDVHDGDVLVALVEGRELARAERRAAVGDDGVGALAVADADHVVGVLGAHGGGELGVEREVVGVEVEMGDGHVAHRVGRRLGLVDEEEVGRRAGERRHDEKQEAAAPAQDGAAAAAAVLLLGVPWDAALTHDDG